MSTQNATLQELRDLTFALIGREYTSTSAAFRRLVSLWNQGAKRAYRASNYWERYLAVGEERTVSSSEVASTEGSKDNIDTFLRVYKQQPFEGSHVQECDFYVKGGSAKIMGSSSGASSAFVTYKKALDVNLALHCQKNLCPIWRITPLILGRDQWSRTLPKITLRYH